MTGLNRCGKIAPSVTPALAAAAIIRSIRLSVISSGFSQITGTPLRIAASAESRWTPDGVATVTKSGFSRRIIFAASACQAQPNSAAKARPFSSVRQVAATSVTPGMSARARACSRAIAPMPMIAARIVSRLLEGVPGRISTPRVAGVGSCERQVCRSPRRSTTCAVSFWMTPRNRTPHPGPVGLTNGTPR